MNDRKEAARQFARMALDLAGMGRVSPEAWRAACEVAYAAMMIGSRVVPVEHVEAAMAEGLTRRDLVMVSRTQLEELIVSLRAFGMRPFPTDSGALRRVKAAFGELESVASRRPTVPSERITSLEDLLVERRSGGEP